MRKIFNHRGFTLIETLVAISILTITVSGAYTAAQTGISSATFSKDQMIAFYLGQEAVEQLRNIRDENALNCRNWLSGIAADSSDPCYFGKVCIVDVVDNVVTACSLGAGTCPILRKDSSTGFYGYNSLWTATPYRREVTVKSINENEIAIEATVSWSK